MYFCFWLQDSFLGLRFLGMSSLFLEIFLLQCSIFLKHVILKPCSLGWPSFNLSPGLSFTRVIYVMAVSSYFMVSSFRDSRQLLVCFGRRSCRIGEELLMRAMNRARELNPCDSEAGGIKAQPAGCSASTQTQLVQSQKGAGLVKLGVTKLSPMSQIQPASHSSVRRRMGFAFLNGWGEKNQKKNILWCIKSIWNPNFSVHK